MKGLTNAGGSGGQQFTAFVQITTDPNAIITMTNPAGDTYSGTANASGSLSITVHQSGTYTVVETDGGTATVVIADNGMAYNVEVTSFNGTFISNGVRRVEFTSFAYSGTSVPTITTTTIGTETALLLSEPNDSAARFLTAQYYDVSEYTTLVVRGMKNTNLTTYIFAFDEDGNQYTLSQLSTSLSTTTASLTLLNKSKKYAFGVNLASGNSVSFVELKLQ